ncbi:MAG TPA: histidinol dehydrogenase [Candidatus Bathyarchaeota archaeon]|nr:histidinol dehydrogenase [Candidatus Bathyarchaeota archaeon]
MRILKVQEFKKEVLNEVLNRGKQEISSIESSVKTIINDVREQSDKALLRYTEKFDKVRLSASELKVDEGEIKEAYKRLEKSQIAALRKAADNIAAFHKKQLRAKWTMQIADGVTLGQVTRPIASVGVYVPGGKAAYPSSVLMCAIPAKVAGVEQIVVCSPPGKGGDVNPALLVAADIAGVGAVYRVGGAQAIAAMAYGTGTVPRVDKIVGPGNVFVTAAKLEVSKDVAIDNPAGPSEVLVIADETGNASFIASDLLAQAEHDPQAWAILLTTSETLASDVKDEVYMQMKNLSRTEIIQSSIQKRGLIVIVDNTEEAIDYSNMIAPEHLQIQTKNPNEVLSRIQNAGAIFLDKYSPVAFGDYSSGLNHVLPTAGYAKIYSGLSSLDFVKTMNFIQCSREGYRNLKETTVAIAEMEGFDAHAKSVTIREEKNNED